MSEISRTRSGSLPCRAILSGLTVIATLLLGVGSLSSASAASPKWHLSALTNSTAAPGSALDIPVEIRNVGDAPAEGASQIISLTGELPDGLTVSDVYLVDGQNPDCSGLVVGADTFACHFTGTFDSSGPNDNSVLTVEASVDPSAAIGLRTASFTVSGGGAEPASAVASSTVTEASPAFGIAAFDSQLEANPGGDAFAQAAGHPYAITTTTDFNTFKNPEPIKGDLTPVEATRDVEVDFPPGVVGNLSGIPRCSLRQLTQSDFVRVRTECSSDTQVGTSIVRFRGSRLSAGPIPVFNMDPPPGAPARLGFNAFGAIAVIDVNVDPANGYALAARSLKVSQGLAVAGTSLTLWNLPADEIHRAVRGCPGHYAPWEGGESCASPSAHPLTPLLRQSTSCPPAGVGVPSTLRIDSWVHPGDFVEQTIDSHQAPSYPYPPSQWGAPQGPEGCAQVPFAPLISAQPTTDSADSASGLSVDISMPQDCWGEGEAEALCPSDLKDASITLPQGVTLNPSADVGAGPCSESQFGYIPGTSSPLQFTAAADNCPNDSKVGTVKIETPLLKHPLTGAIYAAQQDHNPFDSLLAMYLVAEGEGVVIKQAGRIELTSDGQVTAVFTEMPQVPFSHLRIDLFGGPHGVLRTPPSCGTYVTKARLTPWSGNPSVGLEDSFQVAKCPNAGFKPHLEAGSENPLAGSFSPFNLRLTRDDGTQELSIVSISLPRGLLGSLKGVPYCPDSTIAAISRETGTAAAQIASPSCPAASKLGFITAGAGSGPEPFYDVDARVYLAGPYKGAPISLVVVAPIVAGPVDLGSIVVRNALRVDPETLQIITVSDPIPAFLHGLSVDLRDLRIAINRPNFTLNPTSCEPMSITSNITSTQGAIANPSQHFQAVGCDRLDFGPKLTLKLKGSTRRSANPALTATLTAKPGEANIGRVQVALPHSEFLDQNHIGTVCTRVQFAANQCPSGSIYGSATATSPLVDYVLTGNVYLRSSNHSLPDLVLALKGPASQPVEIDAVGRIDSFNGGIRTTFETLPDAPLTKFTLRMPGGAKGLLQNSTNLCLSTKRATVKLTGQNGKLSNFAAPLQVKCGGKKSFPKKKHRR